MAFCGKCGGIVDVKQSKCRECGVSTSGSKPLVDDGREEFHRVGPLMTERVAQPQVPRPTQGAVVHHSPQPVRQQTSPVPKSSSPKGVLVSKDLGPPPPGVVVKGGRAYSTFKNGPGGGGATKLCCGEIATGRFCAQCGKNMA